MPPSPLQPSGELLPWLIAGCCLAALLAIVLIRRPRRDSQARDASMPSPAQQRAVEREVHALLEDLSGMARQIGDQLDSRAGNLQRLLAQADEKIEKLESLSANSTAPEAARRRIDELPPRAPAEPVGAMESRHAEVYALAERGCDVQEIAQQLKRPHGEIALILALRPRSS